MRKLASVQKIINIQPIENADFIECATVLGWEVVVKKGEFKIGDLCIYCEIDSQLPEREEFEFLRPKKFRIKTQKIRKQISQGIVFPTSILKNNIEYLIEGLDVTDVLGIIKYEVPEINHINFRSGQQKSNRFPTFLLKTDEQRLQSNPKFLKMEKDNWYVTEKLDGTSATYYYVPTTYCSNSWIKKLFYKLDFFKLLSQYQAGICSRNIELKINKENENSIYLIIYKQYDLFNKMTQIYNYIKKPFALQGEIIGPGIQKNKYMLKDHQFRIFTFFDVENKKPFNYNLLTEIITYFKLDMVPILYNNFSMSDNLTINDMIELSKGYSIFNLNNEKNKILREGIVVRNKFKNMSFKVINPEFLLKHDI